MAYILTTDINKNPSDDYQCFTFMYTTGRKGSNPDILIFNEKRLMYGKF